MNIGLLGFGVVGGGVWELAQENRALNVKKVLVRREAPSLGKAAVQDVEAILRDTDIDTVVEVLGGLHPAYEWICRALAAGKDVVTANKAVISAYYRELTALAHENGAALRCTAAANVVQDCLDLLTGEDGFYTETARPMAVEADAVAHPYYVRTQAADPWLKSVTADRWAGGVITGAVPVGNAALGGGPAAEGPRLLRGGHPVTGSAAGEMFKKNFTACSNKSERNVL